LQRDLEARGKKIGACHDRRFQLRKVAPIIAIRGKRLAAPPPISGSLPRLDAPAPVFISNRRSHMKLKFLVMAASLAASFAAMPAANAAGIPWGADQQETSAQMDNDLNVAAVRHGYGEARAPQTHRHDGTWR
jgi:hypothetical protein